MSIFLEPDPLEGPVHITVARDARDPRSRLPDPPGVVVHRVPELHPDDCCWVRGLPCTSVSRTLIDLAEDMEYYELRAVWARARRQGQLDLDAVRASRARVEWRPSLALVDQLIAEFGR